MGFREGHVRMTPAGPAETGHFDVEKVLRAVERGAAMNIDLTQGWNPWSVMHRPVDELRIEYEIPPLK